MERDELNSNPEQRLIRSAQAGDVEAFGRLVVQHQGSVFNIAYRLTGNRQEAEDVAQEAFLRTFQNLDKFNPELPFAPWLYRITTNTALNWIKRRRPETMLPEETLADDRVQEPEHRAVASELSVDLRAAIATLPANSRAVLELRHFQGLSYRQMAAVLDAPISDVKSWLFRARRKLHAALEAGEPSLVGRD